MLACPAGRGRPDGRRRRGATVHRAAARRTNRTTGLALINETGYGPTLWDRLTGSLRTRALPPGVRETARRRVNMAAALEKKARAAATDRLIDSVMDITGYRHALASADNDGEEALEAIEELITNAALHEQRLAEHENAPEMGPERVGAFVNECRSLAETAEGDEPQHDVVTLSSLHGAKGPRVRHRRHRRVRRHASATCADAGGRCRGAPSGRGGTPPRVRWRDTRAQGTDPRNPGNDRSRTATTADATVTVSVRARAIKPALDRGKTGAADRRVVTASQASPRG